MRNNLPITQTERVVPEGYILVSETDLQGNIIYANEDFIKICGYSKAELEGQPHNIIRHPDVPEIVFADLWATLQKGEPWHQLVKNRCKNGDYYWVEANVAPVIKNGKVTGYKSIRNPITDAEKTATEAAYKLIAAGKLLIKGGAVMKPWTQKIAHWSPLPQKSILGKTRIPLVVMSIMWSIILQFYLQNVADNLYADAVVERQGVLSDNLQSEVDALGKIALTNAVGIAGNSAVIYGLYDKQETALWQILEVNYQQYVDRADLKGIGVAIFDAQLKKIANSGVAIDSPKMPSEPMTRVHFQETGGFVQALVPVPYGDKILGVVVMNLPLTQIAASEEVSDHFYAALSFTDQRISVVKGFEDSPVQSLLAQVNHAQLIEDGYAVVDNRLLVFDTIKEKDRTLGAHLIAEPMVILDRLLSDTYFMIYVAQGAMSGGFILLLIQVFWRMRSSILNPMKQLTQKLAKASEEGSLSVRADVVVEDEIGQMARNFNHYVSSVQQLLVGVSDMISALSKGNLEQRIEQDAKGDLNLLKTDVNQSVDNIQEVISEIEKVIHHLKTAHYQFDSTAEFKGAFATMMGDLQNAMSITDEAVQGINRTMTSIAEGDFSSRLTAELMGDLQGLKENINHSLNALETGINDTVSVIVAQSNGDLTERMTGHYDGQLALMQKALNSSLDKVSQAILGLMTSANTVNGASEQIAQGNLDLSDRIQEQAASLQSTVQSMESITQMVQKNARSAKEAASLADAAKMQADNGAQVMAQSISSMQALSQSSQKIADIIGLIDSIAFQTNLLALNAAVEAARAGEQGRGFAVVAGEVRTLAGKSAEAAKEIRSLIETSGQQVVESEHLVQKSEKEFSSVLEAILKMQQLVSDIAQASSGQAQSVAEINHAIEGLDRVTQQNAALVEETAASADTLKDEAHQMRQQVGFFRVEKSAVQALPHRSKKQQS